MDIPASSTADILAALPDVRAEVQRDIRNQRLIGNQIGSVENDKVVIDGQVVADLSERKAELLALMATQAPKPSKQAA
jgi:uncharacterized protein involved in propanediol utilization